MKYFNEFCCPEHKSRLQLSSSGESYICPSGCSFAVEGSIPRFVPSDNYASSFGAQWNEYRTTQLDSFTGASISRDRLRRMLGGSFEVIRGKHVLEAGCGAGRFTEILLEEGAQVLAVDLSDAVEANRKNCGKYPGYGVCQADIINLPFKPGLFDVVVCAGVIQHTPCPERTIEALCSNVKPGGLLVLDHYTHGYAMTASRRVLRSMLLKRSKGFSIRFCKVLTALLWPVHRLFWRLRRMPGLARARSKFLNFSPLVDYHEAYVQLGPKLLRKWAALDMHDTLTDCYKHLRTAEEIEGHLKKCGMESIKSCYAGNGVEASAVRTKDNYLGKH